jgi:membrane associated rhomboid family serine protease
VKLGFTISAGFQHNGDFNDVVRWFSLSTDLIYNVKHPWVILTHMFLHVSFWHFLFNMLFLYWFGKIVGDMIGDSRIVPLYLMSGFFGALVFLMFGQLLHVDGGYALGASASVMGLVIAAGILAPEYNMRLLLIGDVRLKYVVGTVILIDLFGISGLDNVGGHLAHLGGVMFGVIFISMLRRGSDLSVPLNNVFDWVRGLFADRRSSVPTRNRPASKVFVRHKSATKSRDRQPDKPTNIEHQERLDTILEKIKDQGYESLSPEDKEFLFQASKK